MKSEVKRGGGGRWIQDEFLAKILDAAASIKKRDFQLGRTTRNIRTRVTKCTEVDGGIFKHLL
jgi:hypothetical protein